MCSMYKLENMNLLYNDPSLQNRKADIDKAIQTVRENNLLKSPGEQLNAAMNILDPKGQKQREAAAAAAAAELQAELLNKKGGRRTQKRPTARRRRSSKARKARTTRRK
jgi:hypothetical protein